MGSELPSQELDLWERVAPGPSGMNLRDDIDGYPVVVADLVAAGREISRLQALVSKLGGALETAEAQMTHCGLAVEPRIDEALAEFAEEPGNDP